MLAAMLLAAAAPATVEADLRCLAVATAALGSTADETMKHGLTTAAMYFVGRIDAAQPGFDYAARLGDLLTDPAKVASLRTEGARCGALLQQRGRVLQEVGARLQARAKARR